jgi:hypothetical protein
MFVNEKIKRCTVMLKNILLKFKPFCMIVMLLLPWSCMINDDSNLLGKNGIDLFATVEEQSSSFIVSGYVRSLQNPEESDDVRVLELVIDVSEAVNWKNIEVNITVDGKTKSDFLGNVGYSPMTQTWKCSILIANSALNENTPESVFSVEFKKNITYMIGIKTLEASVYLGKISHSIGCGGDMKDADISYEINRTIQSV